MCFERAYYSEEGMTNYYENMPECPARRAGMNGIIQIPSPLVGEG